MDHRTRDGGPATSSQPPEPHARWAERSLLLDNEELVERRTLRGDDAEATLFRTDRRTFVVKTFTQDALAVHPSLLATQLAQLDRLRRFAADDPALDVPAVLDHREDLGSYAMTPVTGQPLSAWLQSAAPDDARQLGVNLGRILARFGLEHHLPIGSVRSPTVMVQDGPTIGLVDPTFPTFPDDEVFASGARAPAAVDAGAMVQSLASDRLRHPRSKPLQEASHRFVDGLIDGLTSAGGTQRWTQQVRDAAFAHLRHLTTSKPASRLLAPRARRIIRRWLPETAER